MGNKTLIDGSFAREETHRHQGLGPFAFGAIRPQDSWRRQSTARPLTVPFDRTRGRPERRGPRRGPCNSLDCATASDRQHGANTASVSDGHSRALERVRMRRKSDV
jgi:hypothetical protein